jgi:hypothetical protein
MKAEVDRHGTLLRLHLLDASAMDPLIARLHELGFIGEVVPNETSARRWYGRNAVGELSAEEAGVIAGRVVPKFAREHGLTGDVEVALIGVATTALHQCFITNVLGVGTPTHALDDSCGRAVYAATQARLGDELATLLGSDIEADLAGHRSSPN